MVLRVPGLIIPDRAAVDADAVLAAGRIEVVLQGVLAERRVRSRWCRPRPLAGRRVMVFTSASRTGLPVKRWTRSM